MRRTAGKFGLLTAMTLVLLAMGPAAGAQGHEQVIFSGEAEGSIGEIEFWIWCAVDESGNYDDCAGAVRLEDQGLVRHVEGEVAEIDDEVYQMEVASTRDGSVACTLTNVPPILHGPHNTVDVSCTSPAGSGTTDEAVVVSTG
jgi:hypothetical protein